MAAFSLHFHYLPFLLPELKFDYDKRSRTAMLGSTDFVQGKCHEKIVVVCALVLYDCRSVDYTYETDVVVKCY